jgi:hypothetical protein
MDPDLTQLEAETRSHMAKKTEKETEKVEAPTQTVGLEVLAAALAQAIQATKPLEKKTVSTRKKGTPWTPKDGSPKLKFKRAMYHHGIPIPNEIVSNEEIELLNKIKPGHYLEGFVKVSLRKDRGIDLDYPVKTNSQRLRLSNQFGITTFTGLLKRIVDENQNPQNYKRPEDLLDE